MSRSSWSHPNWSQPQARFDLSAVRDTLLYIESDLIGRAEYDRLAAAIGSALDEIARIEQADGPIEAPTIASAQFMPAGL